MPELVGHGIRATFSHSRYLMSKDTGAGDRGTGFSTMLVEKKFKVKINDIFYVERGPNTGTWWTAHGEFLQPTRGQHSEGYVTSYVGRLPDDKGGI